LGLAFTEFAWKSSQELSFESVEVGIAVTVGNALQVVLVDQDALLDRRPCRVGENFRGCSDKVCSASGAIIAQ
jgi:hypothetical protein